MRILELFLKAYGPFTDCRLIFDQGPRGLHIIYGPNEAGKTSALRAVRDMLYGIPERTSDGFIHSNDQLRVGGRVGLSNGSELAFLRRKGRKRTLLTFDDSGTLEDSLLDPFLAGVSREVFETLFAIDHEELVR